MTDIVDTQEQLLTFFLHAFFYEDELEPPSPISGGCFALLSLRFPIPLAHSGERHGQATWRSGLVQQRTRLECDAHMHIYIYIISPIHIRSRVIAEQVQGNMRQYDRRRRVGFFKLIASDGHFAMWHT